MTQDLLGNLKEEVGLSVVQVCNLAVSQAFYLFLFIFLAGGELENWIRHSRFRVWNLRNNEKDGSREALNVRNEICYP